MQVLRRGADADRPHAVLGVLPDAVAIATRSSGDRAIDILGARYLGLSSDAELVAVDNPTATTLTAMLQDEAAEIDGWVQWDGSEPRRVPHPPPKPTMITREHDGKEWRSTRPRRWPPEAGSPEWREQYPEAAARYDAREARRRAEAEAEAEAEPDVVE